MASVLEVNEGNWDAEVLQSDVPVLVDFWAPWCGPCKALTPTVEALAADLTGRVKVVKCNTDESGPVASRYGVMSIPVLMLFKQGKVVDQIIGAGHPKQRLAQKIEAHL